MHGSLVAPADFKSVVRRFRLGWVRFPHIPAYFFAQPTPPHNRLPPLILFPSLPKRSGKPFLLILLADIDPSIDRA